MSAWRWAVLATVVGMTSTPTRAAGARADDGAVKWTSYRDFSTCDEPFISCDAGTTGSSRDPRMHAFAALATAEDIDPTSTRGYAAGTGALLGSAKIPRGTQEIRARFDYTVERVTTEATGFLAATAGVGGALSCAGCEFTVRYARVAATTLGCSSQTTSPQVVTVDVVVAASEGTALKGSHVYVQPVVSVVAGSPEPLLVGLRRGGSDGPACEGSGDEVPVDGLSLDPCTELDCTVVPSAQHPGGGTASGDLMSPASGMGPPSGGERQEHGTT